MLRTKRKTPTGDENDITSTVLQTASFRNKKKDPDRGRKLWFPSTISKTLIRTKRKTPTGDENIMSGYLSSIFGFKNKKKDPDRGRKLISGVKR